jgi:hypothetical protein
MQTGSRSRSPSRWCITNKKGSSCNASAFSCQRSVKPLASVAASYIDDATGTDFNTSLEFVPLWRG